MGTEDSEPPAETLGLGVALGIFNQLFQNRMTTVLTDVDLTYTQVAMLSHLSRSEAPCTIGELALALEINQPGVTKVVKRLEGNGFVTTTGSPEDRRQKLVSISDDGEYRLGQALVAIGSDMAGWFEGWSAAELASFTTQVERLGGWLDNNRLT